MAEHSAGMERRRVSRRALLRSAVLGGSGLLAAHILGCDQGGQEQLVATPTTSGPSPTPAPLLRWTQHSPSGPLPPPRRGHSLVTDGQRLYLFGGRAPNPLADFWAYDLAGEEWTEFAPKGPSARYGHNAAWDASRGRMLVFGGQSGTSPLNDLWEFDPQANAWTELPGSGAGPSKRFDAAAALDAQGRLLVTTGIAVEGRFDDTWAYDPAAQAWADVTPTGKRPQGRSLARAQWDSVRNRLFLFGGQAENTAFLDDLWTLDRDGWAQLARKPSAPARNSFAMVYDAQDARLIVFGGDTLEGLANDLWSFDAPDEFWKSLFAEGEAPSPRFGHDAAWVPGRNATFVFGGNDGEADLGDLWELTVAE